MNKTLVIFLYFICVHVYVGLCQYGDSLTAGTLNRIKVVLPKDKNYPKYTLETASNGELTDVKEVYDSVKAQKVLSANVVPACNCTSFIVNIIGINKNGNQEKIGNIEFAVRKPVIRMPYWVITYTPHNEAVQKRDSLPIQKNTVIAALRTQHYGSLYIPDYTSTIDFITSIDYNVKIYEKVGMGDYRYIGRNAGRSNTRREDIRYHRINMPFIFSEDNNAVRYLMFEFEIPKQNIPCDPEKDPRKRAIYSSTTYKFIIGFFPSSKPSKTLPTR